MPLVYAGEEAQVDLGETVVGTIDLISNQQPGRPIGIESAEQRRRSRQIRADCVMSVDVA